MRATGLHEPPDRLSAETVERHRAVVSLMEELEAIDWYQQRIDGTEDEELSAILAHNRDEEKEHACMVIEWLRRRDPAFDAQLRRFLFTEGPIVATREPRDAHDGAEPERRLPAPTLGIGSLRGAEVPA